MSDSGYLEVEALDVPGSASPGDSIVLDGDKVPGWAPNGGSQPSTATATVTTDVNMFVVSHDFDLGQNVAAVTLLATCTALVADGETFDPQAGIVGRLALSQATDAAFTIPLSYALGAISDNRWIPWRLPSLGSGGELWQVNEVAIASLGGPRYLRVVLDIYDEIAGDRYMGANHPRVTVRLDLTYQT